MKDIDNNIIYIGKAKNLKKRVSSYFNNNIDPNSKVKKLVKKISNIDYIVTNNELEALILECNLIKKYKPIYNILLKDDKGYKFIKISQPPYSKISVVNKKQNDNAIYIGPYMSSFMANQIIQTINKIFKLPTCNRNFVEKHNYQRPCLNYYINLCSAPCCNYISIDEYQSNIDLIVKYLKSGMKPILRDLKQLMDIAAEKLNFEEAAKIRDQIKAIEKVNYDDNVMLSTYKDIDVISVISYNDYICATLLIFRDYKLIDKKQYLISGDEKLSHIRKVILCQNYMDIKCTMPEVIYIDDYPEDFELLRKYGLNNIKVVSPKKNEKINNIMEMASNNSKERIIQEVKLIDKDIMNIKKLKEILNLKKLPEVIEAYDISNFGSQTIVGSMIMFINGKPKRSKYKKFKIKDISGQNDYKYMSEIVERRFKRFYINLDNNDKRFLPLPDLIFIDGGFSHISIINKMLKDNDFNIPIYGMVKDSHHITDFVVSLENKKIEIKNDNNIFLFIKKIQDEIHRFTISYGRKSHNKSLIKSILSEIKGIGEVRQKMLISHFKTIDNIKNASIDDLLKIKGISKNIADLIYKHFHQ